MKIEELRSDILLAIAHEQQRRRRRLKLSIGLIVIYWAFLYWLIEAGTAHWAH